MCFQPIKSGRRATRLFIISLLLGATSILFSSPATAQCLVNPTGETAVGLKNASSYFLTFYIDSVNRGGVPSGDRSVDFIVSAGGHALRADAVIGGETVSASRSVTIPAGYVCTWTVTDPPPAGATLQKLTASVPTFASPLKLESKAAHRTTMQQATTWTAQADSLRGRNGQQFTYVCPAGGPISSRLWGTNVYTDDSSICTAAVHAGFIELVSGGTVTIEIRPGQASYEGVTRNGVTSRGYGSWAGSFVFVGRISGSANVNWAAQADAQRGRNGQRFIFSCPAGGPASGRVWGTDTYTDDSSICTAAVHAGVITVASGGTVTIEIRPAADSYRGTIRNGITSKSYGYYAGSFVIVSQNNSSISNQINVEGDAWTRTAQSLRGRNGERFTLACPANGSMGFDPLTGNAEVWGTNVYTDDSSICVAAVHAGLITLARGGRVTIEIRAGASSYTGTARNGVTTRNYGAFSGSFVFVQ